MISQEDRDLLFKVLSEMLPYNVKVRGVFPEVDQDTGEVVYKVVDKTLDVNDLEMFISDCIDLKPYLHPMSSLTEKEKETMHQVLSPEGTAKYCEAGISTPITHVGDFIPYIFMHRILDWLQKNYFNYWELPEHLYVRVSEENNPYKDVQK